MNCSIGWMAGCCIEPLVLVFVRGRRSHGPDCVQCLLVRLRCGGDRGEDRNPGADQQTADHAPGLSMCEAIQEPAKADSAEHPTNHFPHEAVTLRHRRVSIGTHLAGLRRLRRSQALIEAPKGLIWRIIGVWHTSEGLMTATSPPRWGFRSRGTYRPCCGASRLGDYGLPC